MLHKVKKHAVDIVVIFFAVAICLAYCCQKSGFFLDELYSYGLANSQYAPFLSYIKGSVCGHTYTGQEFYDYLAVSGQDAFDYGSVYYNQIKDVHPPLYYFFLHTASSVFQNSFSKWIGIGVNIPFFILTNVLLYIVAKKLFHSPKIALCGVILYSMNTLAIAALLMVRMYMLLSFFSILLPYTLIRLKERRIWYNYLFVGLTIFAGFLTQYYYAIYAFFLCGAYCLWLLQKKQYKTMLLFATSALVGVVAVYFAFPYCIGHLFGNGVVSGASAASNLRNISGCFSRIIIIGTSFFYRSLPIALVGAASLILSLRNAQELKYKYKENIFNIEPLIYIIPAIIAFFVVSIISPYSVVRYIYNLVPIFVLAVCFLLNLAKHGFKTKKANSKAIIVGILAIAVAFALLIKPEYLYVDYKDHTIKNAPFISQPCIYITEEKNSAISADLDVLSEFERIYVANPIDIEGCADYLESFDNCTNIVVYISCVEDHEALLSEFCEKMEMGSYEKLYKRDASTAYVLSRK